MKKYLMGGIAAVAICAAFTSCSKNNELFDQNAAEQAKQQTSEQKILDSYQKAFENAFGQPGANQDWGLAKYGSATNAGTRALGDYDSYKGSLEPVNVSFPEDADASNFNPDLTGIPSYNDYCKSLGNANWTPDEFAYGEVYIDKVQKIHIWGENGKRAKLYIKEGTYDFTNETFDLCADADLYLLDGAIVTLNNTAANTAKFDVYIAPGAKLIANGENGYRADVDAHVYNHGTIECTRFEVNGTSFLYNVGALNVREGDVYIANSTSRIVNDGTINAKTTHVEGSGALQNNAEWTVTENTVVNCDKGGWVNNGHWTTKDYNYTAGSNNVINNCFLKVTNEFNINMSSATAENGFKIDSNGGVETKNFNGGKAGSSNSGPYKVIMGHKSLFKVTGTATLDGGNKGWGFFGPKDGDYAVFQAKDVVRVPGLENNQGAVTYGGNLYVSAEKHFAQGNDGQADHYFIYEEGGFSVNTNIYAAGFKGGKPSITIQKTPCNPGFGDNPPVIEYKNRIMGEDLTAETDNDFDFNDVVFDWAISADKKTAYIKLWAAGGTLPLKIGTAVGEGQEVHALFGVSTSTMVNTGVGANGITKEPVEFTITKTTGTFNNAADIIVSVDKTSKGAEGYMQMTGKIGKAPCLLFVPLNTKWVDEYENIEKAYTWFGAWSREEGPEQWSSAPVAKFVDLDLSNNK